MRTLSCTVCDDDIPELEAIYNVFDEPMHEDCSFEGTFDCAGDESGEGCICG